MRRPLRRSATDRRSRAVAFGLVVSLLTMASAQVAVGPANAAGVRYVDEVFASVTETTDIVYGNAVGENGPENLVLDLFEPTGDSLQRRPAIIYIHGGFFSPSLGNRKGADSRAVAMSMAKRGYVVVSIDYRLYSGPLMDLNRLAIAIQAAMDDGQAAVRWFRANAEQYRIHTDAIAVGGYSAGAITALNVNFRPGNVGYSGHAGYRQDVTAAFSFAGWAPQVSPGAPPIQMSGGDMDTLVPYGSQVATCNAAIALGNECEFNTYAGADHISMGVLYMVSDLIPKLAVFLNNKMVPKLATKPTSRLATGSAPNGMTRWANGSAATNFDGRLEVFGPTGAGVMQNVFQHAIGQGWSGFYPFPNTGGSLTTKQIQAHPNGDGRLETAFLGADGTIYHTGQRPGLLGWLPFEQVGQPGLTFASPPSFAMNSDGRLELFAISTGGVLMHSFQDRPNGTFSDWFSLGATPMSTDPTGGVAVDGMSVMAVGADGELYRTSGSGFGWSPLTSLGGSAAGRPAFGRQIVPIPPAGGGQYTTTVGVYRGTDGYLHQFITDRNGVPTHTLVDGTQGIVLNPALSTNADGRLEAFVAGSDGILWHSYQAGQYGGSFSVLYPLGGSCAHSPSAIPNDDRRLEVFCVAANGQLLHDFQRWANGPWFGSTSLGGNLVA